MSSFQYPKTPDDIGYQRWSRAHEFYDQGARGLERMFPGGKPLATTVWPDAPKPKRGQAYDRDRVRTALSQPPDLREVDPRFLHSTQPRVTRSGLSYYMSDEYDLTGRTHADQNVTSNQYPLVYQKDTGHNLILAGHHRSTAALLRGRPLRTRIVEGP